MPKATAASVDEGPAEIVTRAPDVTESDPELLIAQHEDTMVTSTDRSTGEDGSPVLTTHTRPGTTVMYKPTEGQGYVPKTVSGSAMRLLLRQGWRKFCPECEKPHLDAQGQHSTDPNLCTAREPVKVRICPVCPKRIYDNQGFPGVTNTDATADPNVIEDEDYAASTPESRTRASLDLHIWARHPRQAQMMGLPPVPMALRDLVEEPK